MRYDFMAGAGIVPKNRPCDRMEKRGTIEECVVVARTHIMFSSENTPVRACVLAWCSCYRQRRITSLPPSNYYVVATALLRRRRRPITTSSPPPPNCYVVDAPAGAAAKLLCRRRLRPITTSSPPHYYVAPGGWWGGYDGVRVSINQQSTF